jgi:hypothetical protein
MTLVVDRGLDGPQVHVLAIGVGAYRHLPGGSKPVAHGTYGLGQLSGPPYSAVAFVDWIASTLQHPTAPLGTVEVLLSPGSETTVAGIKADVDLPTLQNTKDAFDAWYVRCDADPGNVAVLYFCGHGVQRESEFLLLEDFAAVSHRMLENSIDISHTFLGLASCAAGQQYVFVDACREIPYDLVTKLSGSAAVLAEPTLVGDRRSDKALLFATSGGQKAYGRPNRPTRFTEALLSALDGQGAVLRGKVWEVRLSHVGPAVDWILRQDAEAPPQQPEYQGSFAAALHQLAGPPEVLVRIQYEPDAARSADVALTSFTSPGPALIPVIEGNVWRCLAPADTYQLRLDFPAHDFRPFDCPLTVLPPGVEERITVEAL